MNYEISWVTGGKHFVLGSDIEATVHVLNIAAIQDYLPSFWSKVAATIDVGLRNAKTKSVIVLIELWPDTGRIITVIKGLREIGRLVLSIPYLEDQYFSLPQDEREFEPKYAELLQSLESEFRESLTSESRRQVEKAGGGDVRIFIRDTDAAETEREL